MMDGGVRRTGERVEPDWNATSWRDRVMVCAAWIIMPGQDRDSEIDHFVGEQPEGLCILALSRLDWSVPR
jgi:hypothetical protein